MSNLKIRIMTIEDYEAVYQLWTTASGIGLRSIDDSLNGISKFLERNPGTSFVASDNDVVIGIILCGHDGRRGYIYHTAVIPEYRKHGIGKALVNAALNALKEEQINKAALVLYCTNGPADRFWESVGFTRRNDLIYRDISINENNY